VIVHPTVKGSNLISRIRHGRHSVLERWVGQLADEDLAALNRGIRVLAAVARGFPSPRRARVAGTLEA
jgi:hypothetical protein